MVRMMRWLWAIVAVLPVAAAAKDGAPELLAHTGKWQVDYDKEACHLLGKFGAGDEEVVARFTRYQPGDPFDLTLYGKRLRGLQPSVRVEVAFGPSGTPLEREAMTGIAGKTPMLLLSGLRLDGSPAETAHLPAIAPARETATASATFIIPRKRAFRLGFGSLGQPLAAMRACQTDLVRHWGFDPEVHARLSRPVTPVGDPASWLNTADHPLPVEIEDNNVVVQYRLDVDPDGIVSACHVLYRTKPDAFGDLVCGDISRNARFRPALDAAGKPVRSFYVNRVRWSARQTRRTDRFPVRHRGDTPTHS